MFLLMFCLLCNLHLAERNVEVEHPGRVTQGTDATAGAEYKASTAVQVCGVRKAFNVGKVLRLL